MPARRRPGSGRSAPFRALAEPIADMLAPIPYPEMFPPDDPDYHPTASRRRCSSIGSTASVAKTIVDFLSASDASMRVAQLRVLGGAIARVPVDATAFAHRASRIMVNVAAFYEGEGDKPRREAWVAEFGAALHQGDAGAYVNFLGDEGEARVRAAYPGTTWDRLIEIKRRYDPDNLFRRNQNIRRPLPRRHGPPGSAAPAPAVTTVGAINVPARTDRRRTAGGDDRIRTGV